MKTYKCPQCGSVTDVRLHFSKEVEVTYSGNGRTISENVLMDNFFLIECLKCGLSSKIRKNWEYL